MTPGVFTGLLDDAAIFPPGNAPMPQALTAHRDHGRRWYRELVGPFICSAGRLDELWHALAPDAPIGLSVITPSDQVGAVVERIAGRPPLTLAAIEIVKAETPDQARRAVAAVTDIARARPSTAAFVEVAWTPDQDAILDAIAGSAVAAKLRTGGEQAAAFPTEDQLAAALVGCVRRGIALKCTAGLHHAVRHTEAGTGFENHGFLNVITGVAAAQDGAAVPDVARILAQTEPAPLAATVAGWSAQQATAVRATFRSFGTCSIDEPVADLVALGLVAAPPGEGDGRA